MTVEQLHAISGRTFKKAQRLQLELEHAARGVARVGHLATAKALLEISIQAMPCAERYVQALARGVRS